MHDNKNPFLKMLEIYLELRNAFIKFMNMKPIAVLKLKTKKLIKNGLGKKLTKLKPVKICYSCAFRSFLSREQV